jgi:hypothetical protein
MARIKCQRKMTELDVKNACDVLKQWPETHPRTPPTWARIERKTGFTRPSLAGKPAIKEAFALAKTKYRESGGSGTATAVEIIRLRSRVRDLDAANSRLRASEDAWQAQWQRIVFHLNRCGIDESILTTPIPSTRRKHTAKAAAVFDAPANSQVMGERATANGARAESESSSKRQRLGKFVKNS